MLVDTLYACLLPVAAAGPYFLVAEQESKQRSQLRGGVDRKAFLFIVTSLSCGGPTLSHPPLRTPPGPRRYLGGGLGSATACGGTKWEIATALRASQ